MDQISVVSEQVACGQQLLDALEASGLHVEIAFWAKPSESDKWYLYIAAPEVDSHGSRPVYGRIQEVLANQPDNWLDLLDTRVVGVTDSIAKGAAEAVKPRSRQSQLGIQNPVRHRGMTWFGGSTLGGIPVDGAYIYPPTVQAASA